MSNNSLDTFLNNKHTRNTLNMHKTTEYSDIYRCKNGKILKYQSPVSVSVYRLSSCCVNVNFSVLYVFVRCDINLMKRIHYIQEREATKAIYFDTMFVSFLTFSIMKNEWMIKICQSLRQSVMQIFATDSACEILHVYLFYVVVVVVFCCRVCCSLLLRCFDKYSNNKYAESTLQNKWVYLWGVVTLYFVFRDNDK